MSPVNNSVRYLVRFILILAPLSLLSDHHPLWLFDQIVYEFIASPKRGTYHSPNYFLSINPTNHVICANSVSSHFEIVHTPLLHSLS